MKQAFFAMQKCTNVNYLDYMNENSLLKSHELNKPLH